jgi:hypothetical protein
LIDDGYYVVLMPNGQPWGSAELAHQVASSLDATRQAYVVVADDPAQGKGDVTFEHHGVRSLPYASYQMRLQLCAIGAADLVVAAEGWMMHAAYLLGRPFRTLMMPYSAGVDWHPYGRTRRQCGADAVAKSPGGIPDPAVPVRGPHKRALSAALNGLEGSSDPRL